MSESVVLIDAACCPAANRAAYSAAPALLAAMHGMMDEKTCVDGAVDSGRVIVDSKEEYSAGDRARMGPAEV